jgi:hypothetical protein
MSAAPRRALVAALSLALACDGVVGIPEVRLIGDADATSDASPPDDAGDTAAPDAGNATAAVCARGPAAALDRWILFDRIDPPSAKRHAFAIRANGCPEIRRVTNRPDNLGEEEPVVSADGRYFAFTFSFEGGRQVWVQDFHAPSAPATQVTHFSTEDAAHPVWSPSPDGGTLAFAASQSGILTVSGTQPGTLRAIERASVTNQTLTIPAWADDQDILANGTDVVSRLELPQPAQTTLFESCHYSFLDLSMAEDPRTLAILARTNPTSSVTTFLSVVDPAGTSCGSTSPPGAYPLDAPLRRIALGPGGIVAGVYDSSAAGVQKSGLVLATPQGIFPLTPSPTDDHPSWAPPGFEPMAPP